MYIPKYFKLEELVPKQVHVGAKYHGRTDERVFGILFDERLLITIDSIRQRYGPMVINDWSNGGGNNYRGYRPCNCTVGAELSQHRFGRAVDMIPESSDVEEIRNDIISDQALYGNRFIGGLELGISWLHIDVRARDKGNRINLFRP